MNDNNDAYSMMQKIFKEQEEERKIAEAEFQMRYADRKKEKLEYRRRIESAAMKICDLIDAAVDETDKTCKPEEIVALAAALSHASTAMHAAENYGESRPYYSSGFGLGCSV